MTKQTPPKLDELIEESKQVRQQKVPLVKRFVIGMLGQYGREWKDLTKLQRATFEQDTDKLVSGIFYEVYKNEAFIKKVYEAGFKAGEQSKSNTVVIDWNQED